ncbi:MAG TPA: polysaccharide biosynthesis/export family protein [Polyangiaceae bacterium]|nr:polysaccharide biosynthesis/export family protein [Polyangiaceae bacterium]
MHRLFRLLLLSCICVAAQALSCAHAHSGPPNLPAPRQSTEVGPGDLFEVSVLGEKDIPHEYRVQPDGTVDFPYLDRVTVAGLEPQQIEELIKKGFIDRKILVDPQVTLIVKQYNSKKISIVGAVNKPGSFAWTEGMKLVDAISLAGGLTSIADGDHVRITRLVGPAKTVSATVSVDDITDGKLSDVPLQAGDTIKVDQRVF